MLAPMDNPKNILVSRAIREVLEPTAARELSPAQRPTTTTSAALNSSCSMVERVSGTAKRSSFGRIAPCSMSIS